MRLAFLTFSAAIAAASFPVISLSAKDPSPKKLMEMSAQCAYVVGIAEGNRVKLNYRSADWVDVLQRLQAATGLDSEAALDAAIAKYDKRARVMGADEAFKHMLSLAKQCDREMAVIQS